MFSIRRRATTALAALMLVPSALSAQRTITVAYPSGGPSRNGFASASVQVQYSFMNCDGELWITMGNQYRTLSLSSTYWLDGKQQPVPELNSDHTSLQVAFTAEVLQATPQGPRRVTSLRYETGPDYSSGCFNAINFKSLGKMSDLFGAGLTAEKRSAILASLYLENASATGPYVNNWMESVIRSKIRDAEYAAAKAKRDSTRADSVARARVAARNDSIQRADAARLNATNARTSTSAAGTRTGAAGSTSTATGARTTGTTAPSQTPAQYAAQQAAAQQRYRDSVRAEDQRAAQEAAVQRQLAAQQQLLEAQREASRQTGELLGGMAAQTLADGGRLGLTWIMASPSSKGAKDFSSVGVLYEIAPLSYFHLGASTTLAGKLLAPEDTSTTNDPLAFHASFVKGFDWLGVDDDFGIYPLIEAGIVVGANPRLDADESWEDMTVAGVGLGMRLGGMDLLVSVSPFFKTTTMTMGLGLKF